MSVRIVFVLVLVLFLFGCQDGVDDDFVPVNGGNESKGDGDGVEDYYFCESWSDCWDIDSFECSLENIDLSHRNREINSSVAEAAGYNAFNQVCYNNRCYCRGDWYTTHD